METLWHGIVQSVGVLVIVFFALEDDLLDMGGEDE